MKPILGVATSPYDASGSRLTKAPSRNLVNARLSWTSPSDRYTFSVWGTNLTDEEYSNYNSPNTRGDTLTFAATRQIGIGFAADL